MRRTLAVSVFLAGALCWSEANACGDKFLVVGRGVKRQSVRLASHPGSILIYMNAETNIPAAAKEIRLESGLKKAGHKVRAVVDAAGLEGALKSAEYDLVLADIADSPALEKRVGPQSKPLVVPVLYQPTPGDLKAAKARYGCALKAPDKDYLATIDEVMGETKSARNK